LISHDDERKHYVEEQEKPLVHLAPHDLYALSAILQFYERYLRETAAPSARRSKQIVALQLLIVKSFQLPTSQAMVLTFDEVEVMSTAIRIFISQVRTKIPPSTDRDGVLESCEQLREYLVAAFAAKQRAR
jgi:hypothetical protein